MTFWHFGLESPKIQLHVIQIMKRFAAFKNRLVYRRKWHNFGAK